jgi:RNA polymerase sigma-70 factor (family 1)
MQEEIDYSLKLLVSELKNGNERSFRSLFEFYSNDIYTYSVSILKSKELAEENVQDVFLKVWLHRENLIVEKSFKSFLFTIARNQAFNMLNKVTNDNILKEEVFYNSQKSHDNADYYIREKECNKMQKKVIKLLPPKRKQIFKMSRNQGKSYEEISKELGISISTVKSQMNKALETMRNFFKPHDGIL